MSLVQINVTKSHTHVVWLSILKENINMEIFKCKCGCEFRFETDGKIPDKKVCFMCGKDVVTIPKKTQATPVDTTEEAPENKKVIKPKGKKSKK